MALTEQDAAPHYRERIVTLITFLGGLYWVVEFLLPQAIVDSLGISQVHEPISYGFVAVGASAIGLGFINLLLFHGKKVALRRPGWWASATLLLGLFLMLGVGSADWLASRRIAAASLEPTRLKLFTESLKAHWDERSSADNHSRLNLWQTLARDILLQERQFISKLDTSLLAPDQQETINEVLAGLENLDQASRHLEKFLDHDVTLGKPWLEEVAQAPWLASLSPLVAASHRIEHQSSHVSGLYKLLVEGIFTSLAAAMFSLLAVYIAAAAFRAFRVRNVESALMMAAACVVILGQTSFGVSLSEHLPRVRLWLLEVPSSAAFRAVKIGAAVAGLVMAMRMWLSIESTSFTSGENRK